MKKTVNTKKASPTKSTSTNKSYSKSAPKSSYSKDKSATPDFKRTGSTRSDFTKKSYPDKKSGFSDDRKKYGSSTFKTSPDKKSFSDKDASKSFKSREFSAPKDGDRFEKKPYLGKKEFDRTDKKPFVGKKEFDRTDKKPYAAKKETGRVDKKTPLERKAINDAKDHHTRNRRDDYDKLSTAKPVKKYDKKPLVNNSKAVIKRAVEIDRDTNTMRLNRYLSMCGVASRRKADEIIAEGKVKLNGVVVTEPGTKWNKGDVVYCEGKRMEPQQLVYILLNKPKNTLATNSDEKGRKTVFDHIDDKLARLGLVDLRLFTVGRLDRNSLGVLLITNDGDLAQDLTHPSKEVEKIYQVQLDKDVTAEDMEKLASGITLEDGFIHCDKIAYVHELAKDEVGVEIHSGKNRIVRRMFDHLGYNVIKLDRVSFAGLTKKDLPRGKWRFLKENEVRQLKHFNQPKSSKKNIKK